MRLTPSTFARAIPAALLLLAFVVAPVRARGMDVQVWTDRGDDAVYEPGDAMRVKVRTSDDAYLLVYELDSEGNVNLLYPWKRSADRVEGRRTLRLPEDGSDYQLVVERATGQGFIVAIASDRPFRELPWFLRPYDPQAAAVGYEGDEDTRDEEGFDDKGRVVGDPYVAMERIRRRVLERPGDVDAFATSYSTYYVHEQVRYPRYLCNDCHRPQYWAWWNGFDPYYTHCSVVDFRVNWSWCWGPQLWTSYVPYYFFVARNDCPPRFQRCFDGRPRFSSWDGWRRWNDVFGGQLRRFKPAAAPVGYTPPPPTGGKWREGQTPPGFVPPDVRRQTGSPGTGPQGWMGRDRGDGRPVWREGPRVRPDNGGGGTPASSDGGRGQPGWREWRPRGGDAPQPPQGGAGRQEEQRHPGWRPADSPRNDPPRNDPPRVEPPRNDPPRYTPPRNDPPRNDPPRQNPPPSWRQPPSEGPRWTPPPSKPAAPRGRGGKG